MDVLSIIFDLDGTLLDTLRGLTETTNHVMQECNFPEHSSNSIKQFVGDGMRSLITRAAPGGTSMESIEKCCRLFEKHYAENWQSNCCPYDGISAMLTALEKQEIPLAILSNKPHLFTQMFVDHFFPQGTFQHVYGQRDGFEKKPDPEVAIEIAKELGVTTEYILFVGDSGVDIQTGKNAGMKTAGVTWGFRSREELLLHKPDILLNHPSELFDHVIFTR